MWHWGLAKQIPSHVFTICPLHALQISVQECPVKGITLENKIVLMYLGLFSEDNSWNCWDTQLPVSGFQWTLAFEKYGYNNLNSFTATDANIIPYVHEIKLHQRSLVDKISVVSSPATFCVSSALFEAFPLVAVYFGIDHGCNRIRRPCLLCESTFCHSFSNSCH